MKVETLALALAFISVLAIAGGTVWVLYKAAKEV